MVRDASAASTKSLDSTIDVVTPENISFEYELAGPFRRIPAYFIDLAIRLVIWVVLLIAVSLSGMAVGGGELAIAIWLLCWVVMEWFYGGLLETYFNGQTFGKRMFGLRVLRTDGQPINGLQAVMRNILRFVDMMPLISLQEFEAGPLALPTCMFGLLAPMMNRRYQRLGDLVCGTMVVVEERRWAVAMARLDDAAIHRLAAELPGNLTVSHKLSRALATYVERRRYLSPLRRAEIAKHLGDILLPQLKLPTSVDHDGLLCALYVRTFVAPTAREATAHV